MPPMSTAARLRNHQLDLRDMLLVGGVGQFNVLLAIPFMMMLPGTCEPYAQGVQLIVKGLQNLLNQRGAKLTPDGWMGANTIKAVMSFSGPRWADKTWAQIYGDVIAGKPWQGFVRNARGNDEPPATWANPITGSLSGDPVTNLLTNPLVLAGGAFFVWWQFFRKKGRGSSSVSSSQRLLPAGDLEDL